VPCPVSRIVPRDGYLSITSGMWAGYELSVTRALGHKHLAAHGVTPEPYVNVVHLRGDECCLVGVGKRGAGHCPFRATECEKQDGR
jgi:hypothetical protein